MALFVAKVMFKKWEATMALNGVLAGLVAITAPCMWVSIPSAIIIGAIAGVLVVFSVVFIEHTLKIDDPVGAISVHGVCGAWGTLSLGLFSIGTGEAMPKPGLFTGGDASQLIIQATGVLAVFGWALVTGAICFYGIKLHDWPARLARRGGRRSRLRRARQRGLSRLPVHQRGHLRKVLRGPRQIVDSRAIWLLR